MLFLINLDSAAERRRRMAQQIAAAGLTARCIGIDLRQREPAALAAELARRFPRLDFDLRRLSGAELGCWASHLAAWERLLASDAAAATVIEDDLRLAAGFAPAIAQLHEACPLDLVYLGTSSRNISRRRRQDVGTLAIHAPVGLILNTWGYTITRAYAERFFAQAQGTIDLPIDHFLGGRARWARPAIGVLRPPVVEDDPALSRRSQIGPYTNRLDRAPLLRSRPGAWCKSQPGEAEMRVAQRATADSRVGTVSLSV